MHFELVFIYTIFDGITYWAVHEEHGANGTHTMHIYTLKHIWLRLYCIHGKYRMLFFFIVYHVRIFLSSRVLFHLCICIAIK